jgi:hypothetical protein
VLESKFWLLFDFGQLNKSVKVSISSSAKGY